MTGTLGVNQAPQFAEVKVDIGPTLEEHATKYPTLQRVLLELIQNGLDEGADRIYAVVNHRTRHAAVRDNGRGTTIPRFNAALASISRRNRKKKDNDDSLGQFGLGLISPLGQCEYFMFTSCPRPDMDKTVRLIDVCFHEWKFVTSEVIRAQDRLQVPIRRRTDLSISDIPQPRVTKVNWSSEMSLFNITRDKRISGFDLDELVREIQYRYGLKMRKNNAVISIEVTDEFGKTERRDNVMALKFEGTPLPEVVYQQSAAGRVAFKMFIANSVAKKGRVGKVIMHVEKDIFGVAFHYFIRSAGKDLGKATIDALSSGLFEGEITAEKIKLHSGRQSFVDDDARLDLCIAIEEWFDQHGRKYVEEIRESREEERHQALSLKAITVVEELLKDPSNAALAQVIESFRFGTIGKGHTDPKKKDLAGEAGKGLSTDGEPDVPKGPRTPADKPGTRTPATDERKTHKPFVADGPRGPVRKKVRSSSLGLRFAREAVRGSRDLWRLDTEEGVLYFNSAHPSWAKCNDKDANLMKLMENVAMQALTLHAQPIEVRPVQREAFDRFTEIWVTWLLQADEMRKKDPTAEIVDE